MDLGLRGKRVLVTGAGKGIGRAICESLHTVHGAQVVALSRDSNDLVSLAEACPGTEIIVCDLENIQDIEKAVEQAGRVDCLVNNAGIANLESFLELRIDSWNRVMNVNLRAVMLLSQLVARQMVSKNIQGAIVNISSVGSSRAIQDHTSYCTSKAGLDMLTKMMALELGQYNIRVNAVNPTVILTSMGKFAWSDPVKSAPLLDRIPLHRFAEVAECVDLVLFLLSDKASMVNGAHIPLDGGFSVS